MQHSFDWLFNSIQFKWERERLRSTKLLHRKKNTNYQECRTFLLKRKKLRFMDSSFCLIFSTLSKHCLKSLVTFNHSLYCCVRVSSKNCLEGAFRSFFISPYTSLGSLFTCNLDEYNFNGLWRKAGSPKLVHQIKLSSFTLED